MANWIKRNESEQLYDGLSTIISAKNLTIDDYKQNLRLMLLLLGDPSVSMSYDITSLDNLFFKEGDSANGSYTKLLISCIANPIFYFFVMPRSKDSLYYYPELDNPDRFLNRVENEGTAKKYFKPKSVSNVANKSFIILWDDYIRERVPIILSRMMQNIKSSHTINEFLKYANFSSIKTYFDKWINEAGSNLTFSGYINNCILRYMKEYLTFEQSIVLSQICVIGSRALLNMKRSEYYIPNHITQYIINNYKPYPCSILFCILIINTFINLYGVKAPDDNGVKRIQHYIGVDIYINDKIAFSSTVDPNDKKMPLAEEYNTTFSRDVNYTEYTEKYSFEFWCSTTFSDHDFCYKIFNENVNAATGLLKINIADNTKYKKSVITIINKMLAKMLNQQYNDYSLAFSGFYWMSPYDMCGAFNSLIGEMIEQLILAEQTSMEYGIIINNANITSSFDELDYDRIVADSGLGDRLVKRSID